MCSGVMVAPDVALTAAHCVDTGGKAELVVFRQKNVKASDCHIGEVEEISYAPNAQPDLPLNVHSPDILLIKLKSPLCDVKIASVQKEELQEGDLISQAGYGSGSGIFGKSNQTELEIVNFETAQDSATPRNKIEKRLLEMSEQAYIHALPTLEGSSVCHGDSGGPTFLMKAGEMFVYGVNGAILPNDELGSDCQSAYVHLLTPTAPYFDWIQSKVLQWQSPLPSI